MKLGLILILIGSIIVHADDCSDIQYHAEIETLAQDALKICEVPQQHVLTNFFATISPCDAKEFSDMSASWSSFPRDFFQIGMISSPSLSVEQILQTADEVVRPLRFNKIYLSNKNRPVFRENARKLAEVLKKEGMSSVDLSTLLTTAYRRYESAKDKLEIGECFPVDTLGGYKYFFGIRTDNVALSAEVFKEIESLFRRDEKSVILSDQEERLVKTGEFTRPEIIELKAIRKATEIFEKNTILKNDKGGGFFSNLKGEFTGNFQQNCTAESDTYLNFLYILNSRGLLKHFVKFEQITNHPDFNKDPMGADHVAVRMRAQSNKEVVLDSWFEPGGNASHILSMSDWKGLSLIKPNEFNDLVSIIND